MYVLQLTNKSLLAPVGLMLNGDANKMFFLCARYPFHISLPFYAGFLLSPKIQMLKPPVCDCFTESAPHPFGRAGP